MANNNFTQHYTDIIDNIYIFSYTTKNMLVFPAFITSFSDDRTSLWNTAQIYGKMDPIYTYKNTTRKISISFDVPCESDKISAAYDKNLRIDMRQSMYPIYQERYGEKRFTLTSPPLHRIRYANLIKSSTPYTQKVSEKELIKDGLLGWIEGYTFTPKVDSGFFVYRDYISAKVYSVNLTLNVIHENFLGFQKEGRITKPRTVQPTSLETGGLAESSTAASNSSNSDEFIA